MEANARRTFDLPTVAQVVHLIVCGHPFMDCNHRTAAAYLLLTQRLGKRPTVSDAEIAAFLRRMDWDQLPLGTVETWVRSSFTG